MQTPAGLHKKLKGKLELKPKIKVDKRNIKLLYTPGVADIVKIIAKDKECLYLYTGKGNNVAIVSDGSRILGLGNLGAEAALPVMESKALLYKIYGDVDAISLCLKTQKAEEIISIVKNISINFGAINIEDIESPKCFEIVDELSKRLKIPVFHDDQHGTAVVVLAALLNALKLVKKNLPNARIIVLGAGAAGYGITKLLFYAGAKNMIVLDSVGSIYEGRDGLNDYKENLAKITNRKKEDLGLESALHKSDVFIGVSGQKGILSRNMIKKMNRNAVVFALSNPDPEIFPEEAKKGGAIIVATGRSDFPNQVNNALVFPSLMRKILDEKRKSISEKLLYQAAKDLAKAVTNPKLESIIPSFDFKRQKGTFFNYRHHKKF